MLQTDQIKCTTSDCENNQSATITVSTPLRSRSNQQLKNNEEKSDASVVKGKAVKTVEEFYKDLQQFHEKRSTPIMHMCKISGREIDLHRLYTETTERGGFQKVTMRDEWDEILPELGFKEKCVNASAALKYIYRRVLEKYERLNFFGEDPDKIDALDAADINDIIGRGGRPRYPNTMHYNSTPTNNNIAMSYNYRQHNVSMDKRRQFKLSTDFNKASPYEKLMLSLLSPLPNEQDFAINCCTLMANESKHTLKLNEHPKVLDALLGHAGVFSDYSMRKLFEHVYSGVRRHSLSAFWRDLLCKQPQILALQTNEQGLRDAGLIDQNEDCKSKSKKLHDECLEYDYFNMGRDLGTQDYVGQRVLQVISILRNVSFLEENLTILANNRTFLRFLIMSSNIRWNNIHIQALEITGNIATEVELFDPTQEHISRCFMDTICDGIESDDRAVIINCLEILYKVCQRDSNESHILKCLSIEIYQTLSQYISLNDIMLLIFTLEAIYALTSLGTKSCHLLMQVKGIIDQLISLVTVEAQSYGPDGCILMRVIETIPGNMLPLVAKNIANLQNVNTSQNQPMPSQLNSQSMLLHNSVQIRPQVTVTTQPTSNFSSQLTHSDISESVNVVKPSESCSQLQNSNNSIQDDEQFALSWLGNTFDRTSSVGNRFEQQELYRMYLSHCQKSGKLSFVNQVQFPRLVRLIFTNNVGPVTVTQTDGTEIPGFHYIGIRMKCQPTTQGKITTSYPASSTASDSSKAGNDILNRNLNTKKGNHSTNIVLGDNTSLSNDNFNTDSKNSFLSSSNNNEMTVSSQTNAVSLPSQTTKTINEGIIKLANKMDSDSVYFGNTTKTEASCTNNPAVLAVTNNITNISTNNTTNITTSGDLPQSQEVPIQQTPSALIKSLLANKVNQRQQKQKDLNAATPLPLEVSVGTNISGGNSTALGQPIKVTSTAISALVNNPLMQNTPVKVGQTTIKPLNPQYTIEKKSLNDSTPPPLAPLSGNNVAKDSNGRPVILSNQVLVDIFDKKNIDSSPSVSNNSIKRKQDDVDTCNKRISLDTRCSRDELQAVTPSKNAANLYAEMAASILEDEDLDDIPPIGQSIPNQMTLETQTQPTQQASLLIPSKVQNPTAVASLQAVPTRQIVFQTNQPSSIKLGPANSIQHTQQLPNAMATIKTDQGIQTVPVILQQKPMETNSTQLYQQVIQQAPPAQQTQYVLATNPQGQTYLVAQPTPLTSGQRSTPPPPPPTQTVLVTQTPQQQSTGAKTIIILQQQSLPPTSTQQQLITNTGGNGGGGHKVIMTTAQGQQVLVTQRAQTPQQIFINPQSCTTSHIQHVPINSGHQSSNMLPRQIIQTSQQQIQQTQQITPGQISPSLLNQLNQIPATIKLHQPLAVQTQQPAAPTQPATISRIGKNMSIVQTGGINSATSSTPVVIPQLQQHQSIIQQHIISGGNGTSEKRHVLLGNGRAIEIKETVITQTQPPSQQCQLNSQTIITTQPTPPPPPIASITPPKSITPPQLQQQVQQQQLRTVIEQQQQQQQQHQHPSIIQQKISVPLVQNSANIQNAPLLLSSKCNELSSGIIQSKSVAQIPPQSIINNQTIIKRNPITASTSTNLIKNSMPVVKVSTNSSNGPPPLAPATSTSKQIQNSVISQQQPQSQPVISQKFNQEEQIQDSAKKELNGNEHFNTNAPNPSTITNFNNSTSFGTSSTQNISQIYIKSRDNQNIVTTTSANVSFTEHQQKQKLITSLTESGNSNNTTTTTTAASATTTTTTASQISVFSANSPSGNSPITQSQNTITQPSSIISQQQILPVDAQWLYICDWRNCPRHKYKTLNDLQHHVCTAHAPDHLDSAAEIFCQWGVGPGLCDGLPRKKFALMTHLIERHLTLDSLKSAVQRRIATGMHNINPTKPPVTIIRNLEQTQKVNNNTSTPCTNNSISNNASVIIGPTAMQAIRRHTTDLFTTKDLMDENEGPVTKSIRLTAALILRNLVTYTATAKRSVRRYESHLANIAFSNVESSGIISNILYELNN